LFWSASSTNWSTFNRDFSDWADEENGVKMIKEKRITLAKENNLDPISSPSF
jgi:hypothetical protein